MAAILPSGMRAISVEISPETGAGGFILPNDHVDVILTRRDRLAEKSAGVEIHTSEIILPNVRVLAIDQTVEEKNGQRVVIGKTATLELSPRQAETLALSRQLGTLSLALRSLVDFNSKDRPEEVADDGGRRSGVNVVRFGVAPRPRHEMRVTMRGPTMGNTSLIRTALLVALLTAFGFAATGRAPAAEPPGSRRRSARAGDQDGGQRGELPVRPARGRQVGGDRSAARHQGRAGGRSQDRQRGRPLDPPRLHHRRHGRPDQRVFLRRRRSPDRRLRHRGVRATSMACARRSSRRCPGWKSASRGSAKASCSPATSRPRSRRNRPSTSPRAWSTTARRSSTASTCTAASRSCSR